MRGAFETTIYAHHTLTCAAGLNTLRPCKYPARRVGVTTTKVGCYSVLLKISRPGDVVYGGPLGHTWRSYSCLTLFFPTNSLKSTRCRCRCSSQLSLIFNNRNITTGTLEWIEPLGLFSAIYARNQPRILQLRRTRLSCINAHLPHITRGICLR